MNSQGLVGTNAYLQVYNAWQELRDWNPFSEERNRIYTAILNREETVCRACDDIHVRRARSLYGSTIRDLISLWWNVCVNPHPNLDGSFLHKRDWCAWSSGGGDFAKLRYWNFVLEQPNTDPQKKSSGMWALLPAGKSFVESAYFSDHYPEPISVLKRCWVYHSEVVEWDEDGPRVNVIEALGEKFKYNELMQGIWGSK